MTDPNMNPQDPQIQTPQVDEETGRIADAGMAKLKSALFSVASQRALTPDEITQLRMLYGDIEPTNELVSYIMQIGAGG